MRSRLTLIALAAAVPASMASANTVMLTFEDETMVGQTITDQFLSDGIRFSVDAFEGIDYGSYPFVDPVLRDLRGAWGSDIDTEAVSTGSGLASATIGFQSVDGLTLGSVDFMVARIVTQDITILAREAGTNAIFTYTFASTGTGSMSDNRTVEEFGVNLDSLFGTGLVGKQWVEIAIHNHGGMFGIDNLSYQASIPVVPGVGALAGFVGLAGLRGRRR